MNNMVSNQILLTSDDIRRWREEIQKADRTKAEADAIIADRRKKLDAAAIFGMEFGLIAAEPEGHSESMPAAAERILSSLERPIEHHELQAELRKIPRFAAMLDKHKGGYYYTFIMRMKKGGKIRKVGRKIQFIRKEQQLPGEGGPDAS